MDASDLVRELVLAPLGAPTLPVELDISAADRMAALYKYYSYVPYKVTKQYSVQGSYQFAQPMAGLLPTPPDEGEQFFYVGVFDFGFRHQIGQSRFNEYLIGNNYLSSQQSVEKQALLNTLLDQYTGDPYYEEDFIAGEVRWVTGARGSFAVTYGLGYTGLDKVPVRHLDLVARLVGCTYYERLLAIRKTGSFTGADFTLDTALLESQLAAAREKSAEALESIGLIPITSG